VVGTADPPPPPVRRVNPWDPEPTETAPPKPAEDKSPLDPSKGAPASMPYGRPDDPGPTTVQTDARPD
jgi:hypothetical protein